MRALVVTAKKTSAAIPLLILKSHARHFANHSATDETSDVCFSLFLIGFDVSNRFFVW